MRTTGWLAGHIGSFRHETRLNPDNRRSEFHSIGTERFGGLPEANDTGMCVISRQPTVRVINVNSRPRNARSDIKT